MTKILNYYHLCPINDEKEFLGLSQDAESGTVINTLGKNIIISVKVRAIPKHVVHQRANFYAFFQLSNQKQINSWTVLDKLSSRVVYDFSSESYVGVFGNKWIRCWKQDCNDINKIKRIKVRQPAMLTGVEFNGFLSVGKAGRNASVSSE